MNLRNFVILWLFNLELVTLKIALVDQLKCGTKLLDDDVLVPDSAFSASSYYEHNSAEKKLDLSARAARESYDKDNQEFAWCPQKKVATELVEYLEIDLGRLNVINFVQTRGRFAQGAGKEFIPYYKIKYRREIKEKWRLYKKFESKTGLVEILKGPSDPFLDAYETLDPPIITRWIRIYPFSYDLMRVCMKLQLFGCKFESNVLEYRIPQGSEQTEIVRGPPPVVSQMIKLFQDSSYDGFSNGELLNGGLGRLTDNTSGGNFYSNPSEAQNFVGWNRKFIPTATEDASLTLVFRFSSVRNFSQIVLSGYENGSMKISRPAKLEVRFSTNGDGFDEGKAMLFNFPATKSESVDVVHPWPIFNLDYQIGKFLQLKLYFQSEWILLSEIGFVSEETNGWTPTMEIIVPKINAITKASTFPGYPNGYLNSKFPINLTLVISLIVIIVTIGTICLIIWFIKKHYSKKKKKNDIKQQGHKFFYQKPLGLLSTQGNAPVGTSHISNSYMGQYTQGHMPNQPLIYDQDFRPQKNIMNIQNYNTTSKSSFLGNENNVYASIPGSDNDSSISTDYMASSGANSSHTYTQTVPIPCSRSDYHANAPHIIANPLLQYYDQPSHFMQTTTNGMLSHNQDPFVNQSNLHYPNAIPIAQSFSGLNGYQPTKYSSSSIERSYSPNSNQSSSVMNDHFHQ